MSAAYDAAEWSDLFVASAGATAALAGLLFVAVSINVERILAFRGLPERALEALLVLVAALVASVFALAPGAGHDPGLAAAGDGRRGDRERDRPRAGQPSRAARPLGPGDDRAAGALGHRTLPLAVGGISLIAGAGGGLYWILAGVVGAVLAAALNAWVLMIEILR